MREVWIKCFLNNAFIPVNTPAFSKEDFAAVNSTMKSGWISSSGPAVKEFEDLWAKYCGRKYGVAVSNGTAALELSIRALGIGPGDEVIIPSFTIISCASAVILAGATPVFVDVNEEDGCIDIDLVLKAITPQTKAIMAVHIYGYAADVFQLGKIAKENNLFLIEDAAEMHGGEIYSPTEGWKKAGSFGQISTFSFFINKLITTGEGGMLLTDDNELYEKLLLLRNLGFTEPRYLHSVQGFNYRITALQAALGASQIPRMGKILLKKKSMAEFYTKELSSLSEEITLPKYQDGTKSSYWVYPLLCTSQAARDGLADYLLSKKIETRNFFIGMHRQPILQGKFIPGSGFKNTEKLETQGLYIPSGIGISLNEQKRVAAEIHAYFENLD